jgi:hypothetical protein
MLALAKNERARTGSYYQNGLLIAALLNLQATPSPTAITLKRPSEKGKLHQAANV